MKKLLPFLAIVLSFGQLSAQKFWKKASESDVRSEKIRTTSYSEKQQLLTFNLDAVNQLLATATDKFSGRQGVSVSFPDIEGKNEEFQVWENSNFDARLQAQFPSIRSFVGTNKDKSATINFSVSPDGIQTMVLRTDGTTEFIEPYTKDSAIYVIFDSKTRNTGRLPFNCSTNDVALNNEILESNSIFARSDNQLYKTMRLALSCTGEYTTYFGGTVAGSLAAMNATMTRVNGVLEKDMALHLNIIPESTAVIFTNASTDPYSNASVGTATGNADSPLGWNIQLQNTLTSLVGNAAYDIGHLFGASGGGGNAGCIGCVCVDDTDSTTDKNKGSGFTSPGDAVPRGDTFDIDYVVHEMGHQLGANHTFSHQTEGAGVNVEPGSGSTIMGYAGITDYNVQNNSDAYFTYRSIQQMQTNLATKTCPVSTPIANTPPVITPFSSFVIPGGTPYVLRANVTDAEGDAVTYTWEQNNSAPSTQAGANSVAYAAKPSGPTYRSYMPNSSVERYLPAYESVRAGNLTTMWESVSTVNRVLRFTLTARDNNITGQQTATQSVLITTSASIGPFKLTSPADNNTTWTQGSTQVITWDVNNTNTLPGAENVNIKLSLDGGLTFPYILAQNVPNDGSESIVVPDVAASQNARILLEPTNNVFFSIGQASFLLGYELINNCTTYTFNEGAFALPDAAAGYTVKTINVPTAGTIKDVNISLNATHPKISDLVFGVTRPAGSGLSVLFNRQCTTNADLNVTFDSQGTPFACASPSQGVYQPATGVNMDTYNGENQQGAWRFAFRDAVAGNVGTINSFSVEICTQVIQLATQNFDFDGFALYPNPNNGSFNVQFKSASANKINIAVHDLSGRKIFDKSYDNKGLFSQNLQLDKAQSGIYLVSIADGDKKITKRIIVK